MVLNIFRNNDDVLLGSVRLNRQTCMAASFNDASMECDLHGAQQDIIIVTENIEDHHYLIIPEGKTIFIIAKLSEDIIEIVFINVFLQI
jgi:hypothetical protein